MLQCLVTAVFQSCCFADSTMLSAILLFIPQHYVSK